MPYVRPQISSVVVLAAILVTLVTVTPVTCICRPEEHAGQPVHSLLPHVHHDQTAGERPGDQEPVEYFSYPTLVSAESGAALGVTLGGLLLAFAPLGSLRRWHTARLGRPGAVRRPNEYLAAPLTHPPRASLILG